MESLNDNKAICKAGTETLIFDNNNIGYTLLDFWRWSVSDILSNATRGRFAEFIVGTAIGLNIQNLRKEWDTYDLETENGIKIEVKSAAFIQSWKQTKYSAISFSIKKSIYWDEEIGYSKHPPARHADVYVFCLLNHKNSQSINPLQLEQWDFFVVPTYKLDNYPRNQSSITLRSLEKLCTSGKYRDLKKSIYEAYQEQIQKK